VGADRAALLAMAWVFSNLALAWLAVQTGHPNAGALTVGALDGAIFSSIVLVKASARLEAGMTGLLSGFGLDSITNSGRTITTFVHGVHEGLEANSGRTITTFVHGVHDGLEAIVNASTAPSHCDRHETLELMILRAIWMAIIVTLLALFVKWGQSCAVGAAAPPAATALPVPVEIARGHAA
jgi:hypothetical protein